MDQIVCMRIDESASINAKFNYVSFPAGEHRFTENERK